MRKWVLRISLVVLVMLPVWMTAAAQTDEKQNPISHPSLLFNADELSVLRARAETTHSDIWADIKAFVDSRVGTAPPETAPDVGETEYRNWGNQIIAYAFACALTDDPAYCDLAKTHLLTYVQWDQWDEDNKRDLGLGHMLMGSSLAYDWIYNALTPEERRLAYDGLVRWGQRMYEASTDPYVYELANWWTGSFVQNHHWINHSALGIAGLSLLNNPPDSDVTSSELNCMVSSTNNVNLRTGPSTNDDIEFVLQAGQSVRVVAQQTGEDGFIWWQTSNDLWVRSDVVIESSECELLAPAEVDLEAWVARATEQFERVQHTLNGIRDGSWHEGIQYQNYGLVMSMPFLTALRDLRGIDLFPHLYMDNYTYWRVYNYLPNTIDYIMAHGNFDWSWGNGYNVQSVLRWTAHEYDDPYAQWAADELVAAAGGRGEKAWDVPFAVFEFLYYDPTVEPKAPGDDLPGARTFPDLEGVIWRTGWDEDDTVFGLKTSAYGGSFGFSTFTQGLYPWMPPCSENQCEFSIFHDHADANTFYLYRYGDWLAPENVGFGVWDTQFHNTILIDRQGQFRPESAFYSSESYFANTEGFLEAAASTTNFDYVAADATLPYAANIEDIRDVTRYVVWVRPSYFIMVDSLQADAPHQYSWISHFMDSVSVEGDWIRGMTGGSQQLAIQVVAPAEFEAVTGDDGYPYVRVQTTTLSQSARFVHLLYPTIDTQWDTRPNAVTVEDNGNQMALRVTRNDGSGLVDEILLSYSGGENRYNIDGYAFDGRIAVVTRDAAGQIQAIFTAGGTSLTEQRQATTPLLENLSTESPFEVVYQADGIVAVSSEAAAGVTLYAPAITSLTVNGQPWTYTHEGTYITIGEPAS